MVEFILGKTGSGKSLLATSQFVVEEIIGPYGAGVYIVTNLALNVGELNAYLQKKYPGKDYDITNRIRLLTPGEARKFYLHRETGVDFPDPSKQDLADPELTWLHQWEAHATSSPWRLVYIIDEAHIFFDAREWANVGVAMNIIVSQHRKLAIDRIVLVTQFLKQVELRLREHAVYFHECSNWGMRRFMFWKLPQIFNITTTIKPPPYPEEYSRRMRFNPEIAKCYDTSAGVGLAGGRAPEVKRQTGLPWWTFVALLVLGALVLWFGPEHGLNYLLEKVTGKKLVKEVNQETSKPVEVAGETSRPARVAAPGAAAAAPGPAPASAAALALIEPRPEVWPLGWARMGPSFRVLLSDGSVLTEGDLAQPGEPGIRSIGSRVIVMTDGTRYHYRPAASRTDYIKSGSPNSIMEKEVPPAADGPSTFDSHLYPSLPVSEAGGKSVVEPHPPRGNGGERRSHR